MISVKDFNLREGFKGTTRQQLDKLTAKMKPWVEGRQKILDLKVKIQEKDMVIQQQITGFVTTVVKMKEATDENRLPGGLLIMEIIKVVQHSVKIDQAKTRLGAQLDKICKEQAPLNHLMLAVMKGGGKA